MANPINADDVSRIIVLTHGLMERAGRYWCYVAVKPSRYQEFKTAVANKYNIQKFTDDGFGEIVVSGKGANPAKEITEQVAALFEVPVDTFFKDKHPEVTLGKALEKLQQAQNG